MGMLLLETRWNSLLLCVFSDKVIVDFAFIVSVIICFNGFSNVSILSIAVCDYIHWIVRNIHCSILIILYIWVALCTECSPYLLTRLDNLTISCDILTILFLIVDGILEMNRCNSIIRAMSIFGCKLIRTDVLRVVMA